LSLFLGDALSERKCQLYCFQRLKMKYIENEPMISTLFIGIRKACTLEFIHIQETVLIGIK
jgi:hypothetical protein